MVAQTGNAAGALPLTQITGGEVVVVDAGGAVLNTANTLQLSQLFAPGATVVTVTASSSQTLTAANPFTAFHYTTTITSLTVTLPASPVQNQLAGFSVDHTATTLSITSGSAATVIGTATTSAAGAVFRWFYDTASTTWQRFG